MKATKPKSLFAKAAKFALAALLGASIAIIGCKNDSGGGNEEENPPPGEGDIELVSISIADADNDTVEVEKDDEIKLVVIFNPTDATNKTLKWSPSNDKLSVTPSDDTYTATIKGLQEGDTTITVTPVANEALAKTVTVKVVPPSTVELSAITFDKNDETIAPGETLTVKATAIATDSSGETPPEVTYKWTTTSEDIALSGVETDTVTITAKSTAKAGSVTVDVHAKAGTKNQYGTYTLTIEKATVGDDDPNYPYTLYEQDYEGTTEADWTSDGTDRYTVSIKDGYVAVDAVGNGNNGTIVHSEALCDVSFPSGSILRFDLKLQGSNNQESAWAINSAAGGTTKVNANNGFASTSFADANLFFVLEQTAASATTWTVNHDSSNQLDIAKDTWYSYAIEYSDSSLHLKVVPRDGGDAVFDDDIAILGTGLGMMQFMTKRYYAGMAIDNIVVKSATNVVTIKNSSVTSTADGPIDAKGNATFTATAAAEDTGKQPVTPTYAWSLGEGDADFATLSATTGATVTVTGTNATTKNHTVTVICTVTAGGTTKEIPTSLTVKADASLLTDIGFADTNETEVEAGEKITLTTTGGEAAEGIESKVELAWTSNKTGVATVTKTGEVEGIGEGAATITVTATLDDIVKSATWDITVTPSKKPLESVTVTPDKGELATGGRTITFTASTNDRVVPDTWKVTAEPSDAVDIDFDEKEKTDTLPVTVTSKDATGTVTITVTATKDGDEPETAEEKYTLTLREPKWETVYSQDFESASVDDVSKFATTATGSIANPTGGWVSIIQSGTIENFSNVDGDTDARGDYGKYLAANQGGSGDRSWNTTFDLGIPESGDYVLEFDAAIGPGNNVSASTAPHQFAVVTTTTTNAVATAYLLSLTTTETNGTTGQEEFTWTLNDAENTTIKLKEWEFAHYKLVVGTTITVTITKTDGTPVTVELEKAGDSTVAKAFECFAPRGARGTVLLDNVVVTAEQ